MEGGKLRDWLTFEVKTEGQDSFSAPVEFWETAFEDWGWYQGVGSREFPLSQKRQSETSARFVVRFREGIDPANYRIRFDGRIWNIAAPVHDLKRSTLTIEASELK